MAWQALRVWGYRADGAIRHEIYGRGYMIKLSIAQTNSEDKPISLEITGADTYGEINPICLHDGDSLKINQPYTDVVIVPLQVLMKLVESGCPLCGESKKCWICSGLEKVVVKRILDGY